MRRSTATTPPASSTSERYVNASRIASEVTANVEPRRSRWASLEDATSHPVLGYVIMVAVVLGMFYSVFTFGDYTSNLLGQGFTALEKAYYAAAGLGPLQSFVWNGLAGGLIAGTTIALPYIVPFYLALSLLEDSGYLARVAFLMDSFMHKIGLHGKGFIPMMLGFGCNVPAVLASNIMETERERLICAFVSSLVPCAARSIVIMGIVAAYLGFGPAAALYVIDFVLIFILGRIAFKTLPGEPVGLIMEMPAYKLPSAKITAQRTWFRLKDFVFEAFPIIVAGELRRLSGECPRASQRRGVGVESCDGSLARTTGGDGRRPHIRCTAEGDDPHSPRLHNGYDELCVDFDAGSDVRLRLRGHALCALCSHDSCPREGVWG